MRASKRRVPDAKPMGFALAFLAGGAVGALLSHLMSDAADGLAERVPGPAATAG